MKKPLVKASLLLVDDDPSIIQILGRVLSNYSDVRFATCGADALRLVAESPPDLILLDAQMGDMSGLAVCEALKSDPALANLPIIFISSLQESELETAVLDIGAVDFIRKPFSAAQVCARVNTQLNLKRLTDQLETLTWIDAATGLFNARAHHETAARELSRASESRQRLSLVALEIDCFDAFEEAHGAKAAQACLASVAQSIQRCLERPGHRAARLEANRFALILPDTPAGSAIQLAHCVLEAVEALAIAHGGSTVSNHVTCSAGVVCFDGASAPADGSPATDAMAADDAWRQAALQLKALEVAEEQALEQARQAGRAQAVLGTVLGAIGAGLRQS
ncbi:MAG: diguanylate cyclase [Variovorax sp.]